MLKKFFVITFVLILVTVFLILFPKFKEKDNTEKTVNKTEVIEYKQDYVPQETKEGECWTESIAASSNDKA